MTAMRTDNQISKWLKSWNTESLSYHSKSLLKIWVQLTTTQKQALWLDQKLEMSLSLEQSWIQSKNQQTTRLANIKVLPERRTIRWWFLTTSVSLKLNRKFKLLKRAKITKCWEFSALKATNFKKQGKSTKIRYSAITKNAWSLSNTVKVSWTA